jgi:hypothetical protein
MSLRYIPLTILVALDYPQSVVRDSIFEPRQRRLGLCYPLGEVLNPFSVVRHIPDPLN